MQFHITFHALVSPRLTLGQPFGQHNRGRNRKIMDLTFLGTTVAIRRQQISFLLCGTGNERYISYLFNDANPDRVCDIDEEDDEDSYEGDFVPDRVAGVDCDEETHDAHMLLPCRAYFLLVVAIRLTHVVRDSRRVVETIEKAIERCSDELRSSSPGTNLMKPEEWINHTLKVLHEVRSCLQGSILNWVQFSNPEEGDINYFLDLTDGFSQNHIRDSLRKIRNSYQELTELENLIDRLIKGCKEYRESAAAALAAQNSRTSQLTSTLALITAAINPFNMVNTFFTTPDTVLGFKRNSRAWIIAMAIVALSVGIILDHLTNRRLWRWLEKRPQLRKAKPNIPDPSHVPAVSAQSHPTSQNRTTSLSTTTQSRCIASSNIPRSRATWFQGTNTAIPEPIPLQIIPKTGETPTMLPFANLPRSDTDSTAWDPEPPMPCAKLPRRNTARWRAEATTIEEDVVGTSDIV